MSGRLNRHGLGNRVNSEVCAAEINDIRQLGEDFFGGNDVGTSIRTHPAITCCILVDRFRADIQVHVALSTDTTSFLHLQEHCPTDNIPRGKVFDGRRISFHEALAFIIEQDPTFTSHTLCDQDAHAINAGRMELEEFHIFRGDTTPQGHRNPITGICISVGGNLPNPPMTTGGDDHRFGVKYMQFAGQQLSGNNSCRPATHDNQVDHLKFIKEIDIILDALLVEGLQDHMPRAICCIASPANRLPSLIIRVTTKWTLSNQAFRCAGER